MNLFSYFKQNKEEENRYREDNFLDYLKRTREESLDDRIDREWEEEQRRLEMEYHRELYDYETSTMKSSEAHYTIPIEEIRERREETEIRQENHEYYYRRPHQYTGEEFHITVEDVYKIDNKCVVKGIVDYGTVFVKRRATVGTIEGATIQTVILTIEGPVGTIGSATKGDEVWMLLKNIKVQQIRIGDEIFS